MCTDPSSVACWLESIDSALRAGNVWIDVWLPVASVIATVLLGIAALRASSAANRLAKQNTELALRAERRRYGDAVLSYYKSREDDVRAQKNANMPHWVDAARAVGLEVGEPNSEKLLTWVLATIDHAMTGPRHDRGLNALWITEQLPVVIAKWVNDPKDFDEPAWRLYHER